MRPTRRRRHDQELWATPGSARECVFERLERRGGQPGGDDAGTSRVRMAGTRRYHADVSLVGIQPEVRTDTHGGPVVAAERATLVGGHTPDRSSADREHARRRGPIPAHGLRRRTRVHGPAPRHDHGLPGAPGPSIRLAGSGPANRDTRACHEPKDEESASAQARRSVRAEARPFGKVILSHGHSNVCS